ncbi:MAG TPA: type IV secretion system DotC family protein [Gammaproteobacteria bacterium]|nr:type IV secretion system DotC family protein [Gammaproteobacteria bacterium]
MSKINLNIEATRRLVITHFSDFAQNISNDGKLWRILSKLVFIFIAATLITACSSNKKPPPPSIINGYPATATDGSQVNQIRQSILTETATSMGAQSGLAWASQRINKILDMNERNLDQTFNFHALLLNQNVLPPVLTQGEKALNLDNPETLRLADRVFKIESPPRFVTAPPSWREYLYMNYEQPEKPPGSLLPRTDEERKIWNDAVAEGWQDGIQQANSIFSENMGRLKRDYNGMITYRVLLAQNMVTAPFVAKTDLGVTGDDNQMRINDQVLRITATSKLIPNSKKWKAIVLPGTDGAIRKQGTEGTEMLE